MRKDWFESWFDSPFYHILYQNRDQSEANYFIDNLIQFLHPEKGAKILDLACGKGRHAIYLNQKGFDVTGADLSEQSIQHASQFSNDSLHFKVHDMREVLVENEFDVITNMFTSFGYFEERQDNEKVVAAVAQMLKPGGRFVFDFLNAQYVTDRLVPFEKKQVENIDFTIQKKVVNNQIIKSIEFEHEGTPYHFEEKVWALPHSVFHTIFEKHGLTITHQFGDYALQSFDEKESSRLILIAEKQA